MTRREEIIRELMRESRSIDELARLFRCSRREILEDLRHVQRSLRAEGRRLFVLPPLCNSCGEAINIKRVKNIKRCPKCRGSNLTPARFIIKRG
ncbi:MAG: transcriptional regulator [Euryarchaeota archaeon]|nr:transcriptional regulator [Euryarchaeota archaeon]